MIEARLPRDLPEHLARLYNYKTGKFETPLDEWGIADVDKVFELAIYTYPGELPAFSILERNKHHLYWTADWWAKYANRQKNLSDRQTVWEFRNSAPQVAYVPIPIHKWIEISQEPPPVPDMETMRRRNAGWQSAALLLKCAQELDSARNNYDANRGTTRRVLSYIPGITPKHGQLAEEPLMQIDVTNNEYWLSELEDRLEGWRHLVATKGDISAKQGILPLVRLSEVRKLNQRIHKNSAFIPALPSLAS